MFPCFAQKSTNMAVNPIFVTKVIQNHGQEKLIKTAEVTQKSSPGGEAERPRHRGWSKCHRPSGARHRGLHAARRWAEQQPAPGMRGGPEPPKNDGFLKWGYRKLDGLERKIL